MESIPHKNLELDFDIEEHKSMLRQKNSKANLNSKDSHWLAAEAASRSIENTKPTYQTRFSALMIK